MKSEISVRDFSINALLTTCGAVTFTVPSPETRTVSLRAIELRLIMYGTVTPLIFISPPSRTLYSVFGSVDDFDVYSAADFGKFGQNFGYVPYLVIALEKNIKVVASDVDESALNVAKKNAEELGANVEFIQSDMFSNIQTKFDLVVSNPPYISEKDMTTLPKDVQKEPHKALFGGEDGLDFYRIIAKECPLNENGVIVLEIGDKQANDIREIFKDYSSVEIFQDLGGADRIAVIKK